jgi:hypothetical protein
MGPRGPTLKSRLRWEQPLAQGTLGSPVLLTYMCMEIAWGPFKSRQPMRYHAQTMATELQLGEYGQAYLVRIIYREPTYELEVGPKREPYSFTYRVEAYGEEQARKLALEDFRWMERNSGVGWQRVISSVEVSPAPAG